MSDLGLWDPLVQFQWEQNCQNRHGTVQGFFHSLVSDLGQWGQTSDHCFQALFPWCVRLLWKLLPRIRKRMSHWLAPSQLKYMYIFVLKISVFDIASPSPLCCGQWPWYQATEQNLTFFHERIILLGMFSICE